MTINQFAQNLVWASPAAATGAPAMRGLVTLDIPTTLNATTFTATAITMAGSLTTATNIDATTTTGSGYGVRTRADSGNVSALQQYTNYAASAQWGAISTTLNTFNYYDSGNNLLFTVNSTSGMSSPLGIDGTTIAAQGFGLRVRTPSGSGSSAIIQFTNNPVTTQWAAISSPGAGYLTLSANVINYGTVTVGNLLTLAASAGSRAFVTDASATPTFGGVCNSGSGSHQSPVYFDSAASAWKFG